MPSGFIQKNLIVTSDTTYLCTCNQNYELIISNLGAQTKHVKVVTGI